MKERLGNHRFKFNKRGQLFIAPVMKRFSSARASTIQTMQRSRTQR